MNSPLPWSLMKPTSRMPMKNAIWVRSNEMAWHQGQQIQKDGLRIWCHHEGNVSREETDSSLGDKVSNNSKHGDIAIFDLSVLLNFAWLPSDTMPAKRIK